MTDKSLPGRLDAAEIADITDKGWRMMGLSLCFAVVSAFFLPGVPEGDDSVPLASQARVEVASGARIEARVEAEVAPDCQAARQPVAPDCVAPGAPPSDSPSRP